VPAVVDFSLSENFFSARFFSDLIDNSEYKGAVLNSRPLKYLRTRVSFGQDQVTPTYDYTYLPRELSNRFIFTEAALGIRFAYNEKFSRFLGYNIFNESSFPILELNYTKGFDNLWEGEYLAVYLRHLVLAMVEVYNS